MKKGIYAVLALLTVFALVMGTVSCGGGSDDTKWEVTFDLNGGPGTPPDPITVKDGDAIGTLPTVANSATQIFQGWFVATSGGTKITSDYVVTKDQTLYAQWGTYDPDTQWLVEFDLNYTGAAAVTAIAVAKGTAAGAAFPADPARTDYLFTGWFESATAAAGDTVYTKDTKIEKNLKLYANWKQDLVVVNFDTNKPATGYESITLNSIEPKPIKRGAEVGDLPPAITEYGVGDAAVKLLTVGLYFTGWNTKADGSGDAVTAKSTFSADTNTVYAQWLSWDTTTQLAVLFDVGTKPNPDVHKIVVIAKSPGLVPKADWPEDPERAGWYFVEWVETDIGTGDTYQVATSGTSKDYGGKTNGTYSQADQDADPSHVKDTEKPYTPFTETTTIFANWYPEGGYTPEEPPSGTDLENAQMVTLENAWFAIYKFVIPSDSKWENYNKITVEYMVPPKEWNGTDGKQLRALRLMGNIKPEAADLPNGAGVDQKEFTLITTTSGQRLAIASYNGTIYGGSSSNQFIMDDLNQAWKTISSAASALGISSSPWNWFTIEYKIDGSRKNSTYKTERLPAATDNGILCFGIGLTGQGGGGNTQYIRNVKLVSVSGDIADVIATPLCFERVEGGVSCKYPAFTGYPDISGKNGLKEAVLRNVSGEEFTDTVLLP